MAQTKSLIKTVKRCLKAHGKTYAHVADTLGLTEASVKRLFSENSFSLDRLDQVCQMMGLEISDLVKLMEEQQGKIQSLTVEQEKEIANDLTLLLVTVCVLNRWTMAQIMQNYQLDEVACLGKLIYLDRLKIIELLPKNRIKLLVSPNFQWIDNGPIQQFFQHRVATEYFSTRFKQDDENLLVLNGMLSKASNLEFQRKMKRLAKDFDELAQDDVHLDFEERHGVTCILALRGWKYGLFSHLVPELTAKRK